jgi:hypothetical protein
VDIHARFERITHHARVTGAPPDGQWERFWYGVAQPFLGLRVMWQHPSLRRRALGPALLVLVLAAVAVLTRNDLTARQVLVRYYTTIIGLSSLPSVLFANTYERLAAEASPLLGFGEREPLLSRFLTRIRLMIQAAILVVLAIAPLSLVLHMMFLGAIVFLASGAWTIHWMVVEALDVARVVKPQTGEPQPLWFVAWTEFAFWDRTPARLRAIVRKFGRMMTRLSEPWADEIALVERHPALAIGFGLATAVLLAVPIANLFLRPATLVGAVHLRGHLAAPDPRSSALLAPRRIP